MGKAKYNSKTSLGQQWCCFIQCKCLTWIALKKESYLKGKERKKKKKKGQAGWNRAFKSLEQFATQILRSKQLPLWMKQGSDPFLCHNSPQLLNMFSTGSKTNINSISFTDTYVSKKTPYCSTSSSRRDRRCIWMSIFRCLLLELLHNITCDEIAHNLNFINKH